MKKILIIEDDPVVGHIYRSRLQKEGYEVEVATDGQSGFYAVHQRQPDGILLDLMLPKMNGLEILRKIRAQGQFKTLPILVFTNAYVASMIQDAFLAGATQVFNKATLTPRQIIDAVHGQICPDLAPAIASGAIVAGSSAPTSGVTASPAPSSFSSAPALASARPAPPSQDAIRRVVLGDGDSADSPADLSQNFMAQVTEHLAVARKQFQELTKIQDDAAREAPLVGVYRQIHSVTSKAGLAGLRPISQMAAALEALVCELMEKPKTATPSTLRTVATALDLLGELCFPGLDPNLADNPPISILVVDDDLLCRRAITFALEKIFPKPDSAIGAETALALASQKHYDVIFMDVLMPGMDGFALCEKIRAGIPNKTTPVVFVTTQADFTTRVQSTLSGGSDLIAKPFLFIEVTLKALTFALKGRRLKFSPPSP